MADAPLLRSALEGLLPDLVSPDAGVRIAPWHEAACIVVRGRQDDARFTAAARSVLGTALPTQPSTFTHTDHGALLWISPDEWWLLLPHAKRDAVINDLTQAMQTVFAQVVDNSGGIACMRVSGPEHLTLLRHLTPYDVDSMKPGACVSTAIPRATLTILATDEAGVLLLFRRSFADWVWRLIERSAEPYGLAIDTDHQQPLFRSKA